MDIEKKSTHELSLEVQNLSNLIVWANNLLDSRSVTRKEKGEIRYRLISLEERFEAKQEEYTRRFASEKNKKQ